VQVQKLFFLLDENIAADLGGRQFSFEPYDYGPFDRAVYSELELLARQFAQRWLISSRICDYRRESQIVHRV
jgi:hypothetical protein